MENKLDSILIHTCTYYILEQDIRFDINDGKRPMLSLKLQFEWSIPLLH